MPIQIRVVRWWLWCGKQSTFLRDHLIIFGDQSNTHTHTLSLGLFDGCHTVQEVNKIRVRKSRRVAHRSRGLTALHNGKGRPQQQDGEAIPGKPLIFLHFSPPSPVTSVFYSCFFTTINSFGVYFTCLLTQLHLLRFLISALQSSFLYWRVETAPHLLPTSFSFSE